MNTYFKKIFIKKIPKKPKQNKTSQPTNSPPTEKNPISWSEYESPNKNTPLKWDMNLAEWETIVL